MSLKLQPRERQVLQMLADGMLLKQIGNTLGISGRTASGYVSNARIRNDLKTGWPVLAEFMKGRS